MKPLKYLIRGIVFILISPIMVPYLIYAGLVNLFWWAFDVPEDQRTNHGDWY